MACFSTMTKNPLHPQYNPLSLSCQNKREPRSATSRQSSSKPSSISSITSAACAASRRPTTLRIFSNFYSKITEALISPIPSLGSFCLPMTERGGAMAWSKKIYRKSSLTASIQLKRNTFDSITSKIQVSTKMVSESAIFHYASSMSSKATAKKSQIWPFINSTIYWTN